MISTGRTDLATEFAAVKNTGISHTCYELYGEKITETVLDDSSAKAVGRQRGRYFTVRSNDSPFADGQIHALCAVLRKLLPQGKCLAVGFGNPSIAADSLGWNTARRILATSQYLASADNTEGIGNISVIRTDVSSNSGIDSCFHAEFCAENIHADYIIAIDSLICNDPEKLCTTIQLTDAGISPGSAMGTKEKRLDFSAAGVPVIAIGVPTSIEYRNSGKMYYVTPHDIDISIARYSYVISSAINRVFCPALSQSDIRMLMNYS